MFGARTDHSAVDSMIACQMASFIGADEKCDTGCRQGVTKFKTVKNKNKINSKQQQPRWLLHVFAPSRTL